MSEPRTKGTPPRAVGWMMITGYGVIVDEEARAAAEQVRKDQKASGSVDDQEPTVKGKDFY